ncbi:MAG: hypothetical protein AABY22_02880, partial [Nanoarchaeota archaeon]
YFVFENASLLSTIKGLYFDQFYHDHLSYFWSLPIIKYLKTKKLNVFHIKKTPIQGGSIRVFVCKDKYIQEISVVDVLEEELEFGLGGEKVYQDFWNKLQIIKSNFFKIINNYLDEGKTISCYGCPAKFALFSKFFELNDNNVKYVVDDSKFKQGLYSPESKILIVNKEYFIKNPTDVCILSAWNFSTFIKENNKQFNGIWINPFEL